MPFGRGCASLGKITLPLCAMDMAHMRPIRAAVACTDAGNPQRLTGPEGLSRHLAGLFRPSLLGENKIIERSEMGQ